MGKNLTYLSQLDGLTFELYAGGVLPRLLEQVGGGLSSCLVGAACLRSIRRAAALLFTQP